MYVVVLYKFEKKNLAELVFIKSKLGICLIDWPELTNKTYEGLIPFLRIIHRNSDGLKNPPLKKHTHIKSSCELGTHATNCRPRATHRLLL
jgi:hypothetical protein